MPINVVGSPLSSKSNTGPAPMNITATGIATNAVVTAAAIAGGVGVVTTSGASSNASDTAANIIAALNADIGDVAQFTLAPTTNTNSITLTAGTGVTLVGLLVSAAGGSMTFNVSVTGAAAVTITRIG